VALKSDMSQSVVDGTAGTGGANLPYRIQMKMKEETFRDGHQQMKHTDPKVPSMAHSVRKRRRNSVQKTGPM